MVQVDFQVSILILKVAECIFNLYFSTVCLGKVIIPHGHCIIIMNVGANIVKPYFYPRMNGKTMIFFKFVITADKVGQRAFFSQPKLLDTRLGRFKKNRPMLKSV